MSEGGLDKTKFVSEIGTAESEKNSDQTAEIKEDSDEKSKFEYKFLSHQDREFLDKAATNCVEQIHEKKYNTVVLLDHSARPLYHLLKARWEVLYPQEPCPEFKFINIGREKNIIGDNDAEVKKYNNQIIKKIKKGFSRPGGGSYFDNKNTLILDEYTFWGSSLDNAQFFLKSAFPNGQFEKGAFSTPWSWGAKTKVDVKPLRYSKYGDEPDPYSRPPNLGGPPPTAVSPPDIDREEIFVTPYSLSLQRRKNKIEKQIKRARLITKILPPSLAKQLFPILERSKNVLEMDILKNYFGEKGFWKDIEEKYPKLLQNKLKEFEKLIVESTKYYEEYSQTIKELKHLGKYGIK